MSETNFEIELFSLIILIFNKVFIIYFNKFQIILNSKSDHSIFVLNITFYNLKTFIVVNKFKQKASCKSIKSKSNF